MNLAALCRGEPVPFKPGVYREMPRLIYDRIPALSSTVLRKWLSLGAIPSEFAYWMQTRWEETPNEAMLLGSALDCKLLDGEFVTRFAVAPAVDRRTNAGKAQWTAFTAANKGKTVLTAAQAEKVEAMAASAMKAPTLAGVFSNCKKVVLCGELWGFPCKAEIDLFTPNSEHLLDLKTARDVSKHWFTKAVVDLTYDLQATFYLCLAQACGLNKQVFDFLAVKNEPPWTCKVYPFDTVENEDHALIYDAGIIRLTRAAKELVALLEAGDFTDSQDWEPLEFPEYALRQAKMETLAIA